MSEHMVINDYEYYFDTVEFVKSAEAFAQEHGLSMTELAAIFDKSPGYFSNLKASGENPSMYMFLMIVNNLDLNPAHYFPIRLSKGVQL